MIYSERTVIRSLSASQAELVFKSNLHIKSQYNLVI